MSKIKYSDYKVEEKPSIQDEIEILKLNNGDGKRLHLITKRKCVVPLANDNIIILKDINCFKSKQIQERKLFNTYKTLTNNQFILTEHITISNLGPEFDGNIFTNNNQKTLIQIARIFLKGYFYPRSFILNI
jgi:hypothetical protein